MKVYIERLAHYKCDKCFNCWATVITPEKIQYYRNETFNRYLCVFCNHYGDVKGIDSEEVSSDRLNEGREWLIKHKTKEQEEEF